MSPFQLRSKVCIALIHVRSKFADFAPHMDGNNADFAPHIEGSHADFDPLIEHRHSFRDQKIVYITISAKFLKIICLNHLYLWSYMTYVTSFENKHILRESTFKG